MTKSILTILALTISTQAFAVAPRPKDRPKPQIIESATDVFFPSEKKYGCYLEGQAIEGGGWFPNDYAYVNVTAENLQNAAEVAITSQVRVEEPKKGDQTVKVKIEGITYSIRNIKCKAVEQSI